MTLAKAEPGREYIIKEIATEDGELKAFLFSLGCNSEHGRRKEATGK